MGYFYGQSIIKYENKDKPELSEPKGLFTAVPSRSFFPRGFLWDEGFHQLLISQWNLDISIDVLYHWYQLMDKNGWIGREQILGEEARSKVPVEFQIQHSTYANPPTLLLVIEKLNKQLLEYQNEEEKIKTFLSQIFQSIEKQYKWFQSTQKGIIPNSFRWRGRTENHTLTSGLDDYPRASPPSLSELHLDLLCWMAMASRVLRDVSITLGKDPKYYENNYSELLSKLDMYWNDKTQSYSDIIEYKHTGSIFNDHRGYINLFPLFFGLIPKESIRLQKTLQLVRNSNHLWSPFGIRSLSVSDPLFGTNENYWRGPID